MKKTLIALFALAGIASGATVVLTISPDTPVILDPSTTEYRLDFDCRADGTSHSFEVITTGDQTIKGTNGYTLSDLATSTITFTLGGKLTATNTGNAVGGQADTGRFGANLKDGVTLNMAMGYNGSFYSAGAMTLQGYNSSLNLTTLTNLALLADGISTRELIGVGMEGSEQGSIWYSVNGTSTIISLTDASLDAAGYTNVGVLCLASDGSYTDIAGNAVTLEENQYGMLFTRKDYNYNNNATEGVSLIINKAAVPEPATASLSLLGLAAMMIRRRR